MAELHFPVMLGECIELLDINPNGVYIDGTFGRGGHSREIAKRLRGGKLFCIDRDDSAIEYGRENFREFSNVHFIKGDFCDIIKMRIGVLIIYKGGFMIEKMMLK